MRHPWRLARDEAPIWVWRFWVWRFEAEDRSFVHDPRRRQWGLASLTPLEVDRWVVSCTEPAADLAARTSKSQGA